MMAFAVTALAQGDDEFEPVDLPANIAEKVAGLDQDKVDFLRGSGIFSFAGSHERLFDRFKNKSPEEVEALIAAQVEKLRRKLQAVATDGAADSRAAVPAGLAA